MSSINFNSGQTYYPVDSSQNQNQNQNQAESLSFEQFDYAAGGGGASSQQAPQQAGNNRYNPGMGASTHTGGEYNLGNVGYDNGNGGIRRVVGDGSVSWQSLKIAFSTGGFDNEPPLLEELGINFSHIMSKAVTVLNPFKAIDRHIMDDTDLAGPLFFCLAFGAFLLISGKPHFGYIYGIATIGCLFMFIILNLMSFNGIDAYRVASVLGYSLLPIVLLSCFSILLQLDGIFGFVGASIAICWSAFAASSMFASVLEMKEQRLLVAYPIALLYSAFAIVTVF